ncbi:MAG TPA: site-specific integrase [Bacteroidia bacterium]|nr:site-specific integrase [Bacteroidia bacterium]
MNPELPYTLAKLYTAKGDISKEWYAYYFVRNPETGKRVMFKKSGQMNYIHNKKKRLAFGNMIVEEINTLLKQDWTPFGNTRSVLNLVDALEEMKKIKIIGKRGRTKDAYKYCLDTFKSWLEKENLSFLYPEQFDNKLAFRYADFLTQKGIGNRNFNNQRVMIQALFTLMEDREMIVKNPFNKIKKKEQYPASNLPFSDKQMEDLSSALLLQDYNLYCFTRYMYNLLVRANELTLIKLSYFDFKNWRIKLPPGFDGPTKTKLGRTLEIPETFRDFVKAQELEKYPKDFYLFGKTGRGKTRTLIPAALPVTRNVATVRHLTVARALGIPVDLTLTTWRDTGAIDALEKFGINIYKISQQMGHTSIRTTEIYLASIRQKVNTEFLSKFGEKTK